MTTGSTAGSVGVCIGAGSPPVCNDSTATILTDPRIRVTNLTFYTQGVGTGDGIQPRVLFTVTGTITPDQRSTPVTFTLEGGATERLIEL
jgi:hypothetical protein